MARIIDITPKARDIKPILMLFTSHRIDCFLLCLKCLELYTDLTRFKKIYIVANEVSDEHAVIIKSFQKRHGNVVDIHVTPKGQVPAMVSMENFILARHREDVIIRLSEDVFVTPHWLERLISSYKIHRKHDRVIAVAALTPVSRPGRQVFDRVLRAHYPSSRKRLPLIPIEHNAVYHRFMWEKVLNDDLMDKYYALDRPRHFYLGHISVDCLLMDQRMIEQLVPMPLQMPEGITRADEFYVNSLLRRNEFRVAVNTDAVVHHFSHSAVEGFLRKHVSLDDIWWFMTFMDETQGMPGPSSVKPKAAVGAPELKKLMIERGLRVIE